MRRGFHILKFLPFHFLVGSHLSLSQLAKSLCRRKIFLSLINESHQNDDCNEGQGLWNLSYSSVLSSEELHHPAKDDRWRCAPFTSNTAPLVHFHFHLFPVTTCNEHNNFWNAKADKTLSNSDLFDVFYRLVLVKGMRFNVPIFQINLQLNEPNAPIKTNFRASVSSVINLKKIWVLFV